MYREHFAFTRYPFEAAIAADELFDSAAMLETQARLEHFLQLRGIGVLTGESGCGKTTCCRQFVAGLPQGIYRVAYASLTTGSALDAMNCLARELGLQQQRQRADAWHALRDEITRLIQEKRQLPVLIFDEAHHLRNEVLEDLRLMTNFAMDSEPRMCLLFIGLTELRRRLTMSMHESLNQRLVLRHHYGALSRRETEQYLNHRLHCAGAAAAVPLFESNAIEAMYAHARGMPRQINRLAHLALTAAVNANTRLVTLEHMNQAIDEIR